MMGPKPKPPKETRAELTAELVGQFASQEDGGLGWVKHVLGYFTAVDLVAIRDEMKNWGP